MLNPSRSRAGKQPREGLRLMVPRRLSNLRVAGFEEESYTWRPVAVEDGVTEPLRTYDPDFPSLTSADWQGMEQTLSTCEQSGLLLRGTLDVGAGGSKEVSYVVRSGDFHAIRALYNFDRDGSEGFDAPQVRTLARSLLCVEGPVPRGGHLASVHWYRLWNGELPDGYQRQEIVRTVSVPPRGDRLESLSLVGVDDPRHVNHFRRPESAQRAFKGFDSSLACVSWDDQLVVAGGDDATRIDVTDLVSGKKITEDGQSLTARLEDLGEHRGPLVASVTRKARSKDGDTFDTKAVRCQGARDTPTF